VDDIRSVFETSIGKEGDCSEETLGVAQAIHDHRDFVAPQLGLYTLEGSFQTDPEIDLLRGCSRLDISRELRNRLNRLNPDVYVGLQSIEERRIVEGVGWYEGDTGSLIGCVCLSDGLLNDRVDYQVSFGYLDVLLQMEKGELEFREFLLGVWDTWVEISTNLVWLNITHRSCRLYPYYRCAYPQMPRTKV